MAKAGNGRAPDGRASIIDQGTVFKGTISASSNVLVRGVLEGEITGPGLEVDASGVVIGHAKVNKLRSKGELEGTYEAEQAEVFGRLRDGVLIRADSLTVANSEEDTLTHVFFGECELEIGPMPNQEQAVNEALALGTASAVAPAPVAAPASASASRTDQGLGPAGRSAPAADPEVGEPTPARREDESLSGAAAARTAVKRPEVGKPLGEALLENRPKRLP